MSGIIVATPCATCPFRKDRPFYLNPERRREIAQALLEDRTFHCHNTVDYDGDDYEDDTGYSTKGAKHCAGAAKSVMLSGGATQMMRIAERLGTVRLDALEERGPEVWALDEWQRLNPEGTQVEEDEIETCETCGPRCLAPAGMMGSNGTILRGTEGADGVCEECGEPLCSNCADDEGLCASCSELDDEDY